MKNEYLMCMTYEAEKQEQCRGASGRKFRQVCIYCPNLRKWQEQEIKEKEGDNQNGNKNKDVH